MHRSFAHGDSKNEVQLIQYIEENYLTIDLISAAEALHYNPSYLSRLIKNLTGKSFKTILADVKLEKACELLVDTSLSITDIASYTGYRNSSYFTKIFSEKYNLTPSQYRNSHK
ncbi:MAG: helix-turn-helix domain-containing protein [Lachnospirales bacterium]